jgi:hypothetical protein
MDLLAAGLSLYQQSRRSVLFGEDGSVKSEAPQDFIRKFMSAYGQWVAKIAVSAAG